MSSKPTDGERSSPSQPSSERGIARQLTGQLFCLGCGYDLTGLSIRANCPECGIPVRATILGIVDPHADELLPLSYPRLSAIGLCAWSFGAMLSVAIVWILRGGEVLRDVSGWGALPSLVPWVGAGGIVLSMLGAMTLIRPHRGIRRSEAMRASIGVALYAPLLFVYSAIYLQFDARSPSPMLNPGPDQLERSILRIALFLILAGIILGLRKQAVGLAVRSVIVRTGRVDRQSMLAVLATFGIATLGDLLSVGDLLIPSGFSDIVAIVSTVVISLGSVLFTVGMANICIDTIRLYPVLVRPGVGLGDIFETNREKSRRLGESETGVSANR